MQELDLGKLKKKDIQPEIRSVSVTEGYKQSLSLGNEKHRVHEKKAYEQGYCFS